MSRCITSMVHPSTQVISAPPRLFQSCSRETLIFLKDSRGAPSPCDPLNSSSADIQGCRLKIQEENHVSKNIL